MRHQQRPIVLLLLGIISFIVLICFIFLVPPEKIITLSTIATNLPSSLSHYFHIPSLSIFFLLLALFLFSIGSYFFKSKKHGVLIAAFAVIYLLFRLYHLTNPFFLVLLLALFFVLELLVSSKGNSKQ